MWYERTDKKNELRYDKPIVAENTSSIYLLLPNTSSNGQKGWDWFNYKEGYFNSSRYWPTAAEAVKVYRGMNYHIFNATIGLTKV